VAGATADRPPNVGPVRQWWVLTRRNADVLARNRLTLAVLLGSPAIVIAMMTVLFRPGAFESVGAGSIGPAQTVFWVAFAGFFFGLTYGLLQIVGETAIFRREHLAGLRISAYVLSKVAVLAPVLVGVAVVMLTVLRALDRLPDAGAGVYAALLVTLVLEALAALTLGLLASAAVDDAAQATLALPMICFPQVLFAGAVVPVPDMAGTGQMMSHVLANRWAFESIGRSLGLDALVAGRAGAEGYLPAFTGSPISGWVTLAAFAAASLLATGLVLRAKTRPGRAHR
jgi:ABC transport system ATP-binding/permease protein